MEGAAWLRLWNPFEIIEEQLLRRLLEDIPPFQRPDWFLFILRYFEEV